MFGKSSSPLESVVNIVMLEANSLCPLFVLSFKIFKYNVPNCLVNSTESMNVMPLSVTKQINVKWDKIDVRIIQLDKSLVQAIGEIKNVLIQLSYDRRLHQCINIVIVDISEAYGVLLSRD